MKVFFLPFFVNEKLQTFMPCNKTFLRTVQYRTLLRIMLCMWPHWPGGVISLCCGTPYLLDLVQGWPVNPFETAALVQSHARHGYFS